MIGAAFEAGLLAAMLLQLLTPRMPDARTTAP
jgi:hypothetical protein